MPRIKISGITNEADAKWAAILGVEFVSVSLEEDTDKKVSIDRAVRIKSMLPSYTGFIAELGEIGRIRLRDITKINPGYVQFKNELALGPAEISEKLGVMASKAIYEIILSNSNEAAGGGDINISAEDSDNEMTQEDCEGNEVSAENSFSGINLYQIRLPEVLNEEQLNEIKNKYAMENVIIEGDWELADIKKACLILQPYGWSVRTVIEKSPRRIDYNIMKKYIREISLW